MTGMRFLPDVVPDWSGVVLAKCRRGRVGVRGAFAHGACPPIAAARAPMTSDRPWPSYQGLIVSAPGSFTDFEPPSSTSTSQVPGVAVPRSRSQLIWVGFDLTLAPMIG